MAAAKGSAKVAMGSGIDAPVELAVGIGTTAPSGHNIQ